MSETDYQRGLHDARHEVETLLVQWLAANRTEPEDEQLGYPPFHYQLAARAIEALEKATSADARLTDSNPGTAIGSATRTSSSLPLQQGEMSK